MKKTTFLALICLHFGFKTLAQDTCATAITITPNTYTVSSVNGTEVPSPICITDGLSASAGVWYVYTPTITGSATVSTDLASNVAPTYSDDTRVHIYTGNCTALTCYAGNDDISGSNFLSEVTFNVFSGTSYYIAFDNRWNSKGFDFVLTETAASCLDPNNILINNVTHNSLDISWNDDNIGSPSWEIEYGLEGFTLGTGILDTSPVTNYTFSSLTENTNYEFYLRTNCGSTDGFSNWVGPTSFRTLRDCSLSQAFPYSENFSDGTVLDCWAIEDADNTNPIWSYNSGLNDLNGDGTKDDFMTVSPTSSTQTEKDDWLFSPKFNMVSSNEYTINVTYNSFNLNGTANESFELIIVNDQSSMATYQSLIGSYNNITQSGVYGDTSGNDLISQAYVASELFTPPTDGTYYVAIRATTTGSANLFMLFNLSINEAVLGINEFAEYSFKHYLDQTSKTLVLESDLVMDNIRLYSSLAQEVLNTKLNSKEEFLDLNNLSAGIYIVKVNIQNSARTFKIPIH